MFSLFRFSLLAVVFSSITSAFPVIIPILTARQAAFAERDVAPGSFVSMNWSFGSLPSDISQVRIELQTSDGVVRELSAVDPPEQLANRESFVWAVVPRDAALGAATITMNVNGTLRDDQLKIVPVSPGLFTVNHAGFGTALALNRAGARLGLTNAIAPAQEIALFATGIGNARTPDVEVEVGGQAAEVLFAGPQGLPGLDQINVIVPPGAPTGCYVPIRIRVQGIESNAGSIPVSENPTSCVHPLELTFTQRQSLDAGGTVPVSLLRIEGAYSSDAAGETASVVIANMNGSDVFRASSTQGAAVYSCTARGGERVSAFENDYHVPSGIVFSGTLQGPEGREQAVGPESAWVDRPTPFFGRGTWTFLATASPAFGSVATTFPLPAPLRVTSLPTNGTVSGDQDLTITWDPTLYGNTETVAAQLWSSENEDFDPECRAYADQGSLTIPAALLRQFRGKVISVHLVVRPLEKAQFTLFGVGTPIPGVIDVKFAHAVQVLVQ